LGKEKMRFIAFILVSLVLSACSSRKPKDYYDELERASAAPYERYYFSDPASQLSAAKDLIHLMNEANPKTWEYMDWGFYAGQVYGRASLAAELTGAIPDAVLFRRQAVLAWQKKKQWNYAYQAMLPITPSLDFKPAEAELFGLIGRMDQGIRDDAKKNAPNQPPDPTPPSGAGHL
jgi:hypothetical protein